MYIINIDICKSTSFTLIEFWLFLCSFPVLSSLVLHLLSHLASIVDPLHQGLPTNERRREEKRNKRSVLGLFDTNKRVILTTNIDL